MTISTAINATAAGSGGGVTDQTIAVSGSATGATVPLSTRALTGTPAWTKVSGNANLTVSSSMIAITSAIAAGASQAIIVRGVSGNDAVEFQYTLSVPADPLANTRNWSAANLPKTVAGLARVRAGTGRMKVVGYGDSRMAGVGATRSQSPVAVMAAALATAWGVPVNTNSIYGVGTSTGTAAAAATFDSRVTYTGTPVPNFNSFGGYAFRLSASGQSWTFALARCDSIELEWLTFTGNGTFNLYLDGVLYGSNPVSCNAAASVVKTLITGIADTTHTVTIEWVSGAINFNGLRGWRSTVPAVDFIDGGCAGLKSDDWNTNGTGIAPRTVLTTVANGADLLICQLMTNDENANVDPATAYNTNYTAVVNYGKSTVGADFMMVIPGWEQVAGAVTQIVQQAYRDAAKAISDATTVPLYDLRGRYTDWTGQNGAGEMSTGVHETAAGYLAEYGAACVSGAIAAIIA